MSLTNTGANNVSVVDNDQADPRHAEALAGGNLNATSNGALDLGTGTVGGNLVANSTGNTVTQTGALTVTGTTGITATGAAITLTQANNDFGGAVSTTGSCDADHGQDGAEPWHSTSASTLTVIAGGAITQTGDITATGNASFNAGANAITLTSATNDFQGDVSTTGTATQVTDKNALSLGTNAASTFTVIAGGAISQTGDITATGASSFTTGGAAITLGTATNDFQGAVSLTNTGANNVSVVDKNALTLGTLSVAGGNLNATSNGALDLGTGTVGGNLVANSTGNTVTQTGALTVTGTTGITATGAAITLTQANNDFVGDVSTTGTATQITDKTALSLGTNTASTFTVIAGGAISQTGDITATGASSFTTGGAAITLGTATNDFQGAVSLTNTGANNVSVVDKNALTLGTLSVAGGNLNATSTGRWIWARVRWAGTGCQQHGQHGDADGCPDGDGHDGDHGHGCGDHADPGEQRLRWRCVDDGHGYQITDKTALSLGTNTASTLTVIAGGAISQTGDITATGASSFTTGGAAITLGTATNDFQGAVSLTNTGANNVSVVDKNTLTLGTLSVRAEPQRDLERGVGSGHGYGGRDWLPTARATR